MNDDILFQTKNQLGVIILNRPKALNAINRDMFLMLHDQLKKWALDESIKCVLIKSAVEKAFCAGGDIRAIYENKDKGPEFLAQYFRIEYDINAMIFNYQKPIIALTHGITMGGGVGISIHASHCVAAENLRWAMPETLIGFFPDVGATYYLSRLPHHIGTYLALTGAAINANEALQLNLIKAIVPQKNFDLLERQLSGTDTIANIIHDCEILGNKNNALPFAKNIAECFCGESIEEIIAALSQHNTDWSRDMIKQLQQRSPTSLKVSLRQLQYAKKMTFNDIIKMDFYIASMMLKKHDFYEGVRAAIIDKDKTPHWLPRDLEKVSASNVDDYFK